MTPASIAEVEAEMTRLHKRIKALKLVLGPNPVKYLAAVPSCPESGAVRRASLDLTRALARLRKP